MKQTNQPTSIDEYITSFPQEVQERLTLLRNTVKEIVPQVEETMSYRMPTFKLNGKYLAYFAGFKNHVSLFPFPSGIEAFKDKTKNYVTSKGTIQFQNNEPIPLDLVKEIIRFRVEENQRKTESVTL